MTTCEHCGSTEPGHADVHRLVGARRAAHGRWASGAAAVVLAAASAAALTSSGTGPATAGWLTLAGALGWAVATTAGVLTAGLAHRPGSPRGRSAAVSLAIGALVTGALTPLVALAVALRAGGVPIAAVVTWSAVGFLAAGALAFVAGQVQMRVDLLDAGRRGDRARAAAARATRAGDVGAFAGVVVPALAFAAWVLLLSLLPALVVVLVPLHVVLVATARQAGGRAPRMGRGAAHQS